MINAISIRTGGSETFLRNIIPFVIAQLPDVQFYILLRLSRAENYNIKSNNVKFVYVPDNKVSSSLKKLILEHIVIIKYHINLKTKLHWQMDELLSPMFFLFGIKTIAVYHSTPMVFIKRLTNDGLFNDIYMMFMRKMTAMFATIPICVSNHARAELNGLYASLRNRLSVIYHGVNHDVYFPGEPDHELLHKYGLQKDTYILSISNRFVWKNYFRLIQSFNILKNKCGLNNIKLVLIGEKKCEAEEYRIAEYINANNLSVYVKIIPFIDQSLLHNFYKGARVYVFSSMEETFGLTILEAMASGIPVACANWGAIPEIAGTAGVYFDPLDIEDMATVLKNVLVNEPLRKQQVDIGLMQSSKFSWIYTANAYSKIINMLVAENLKNNRLY